MNLCSEHENYMTFSNLKNNCTLQYSYLVFKFLVLYFRSQNELLEKNEYFSLAANILKARLAVTFIHYFTAHQFVHARMPLIKHIKSEYASMGLKCQRCLAILVI